MFLFTTCQIGAEGALKKEIARDYPDFRFAYSRPGFVTFKWNGLSEIPAEFELRSVFARAYGLSLKKLGTELDEAAKRNALIEEARELSVRLGVTKLHLHLWRRDLHAPGEEPREDATNRLPELKLGFESVFQTGSEAPAVGDLVFDVIILEEDEWWLGFHRHSVFHSPYPGGIPPLTLPPDVPSRAYLKIEEAIDWSGAPVKKGDLALEVGSAPGGASFALLQRGLNVIGIDPAEMDPRILRHSSYRHFPRQVNSVMREELPEKVDWFLLDMNVAPNVSLFAADRLISRTMDTLLGVFLTVKLNQWRFANEIPGMLEHVRAMGLSKVRAKQLFNHRQEFLIHGLTRRGLSHFKQ